MSAVMTEAPTKPVTPRQLIFQCKLNGDVTLELMTHGRRGEDGVHRWTQLSASLLTKPPKGRIPPRPVKLAWALANLTECRLTRWSYDDTLWIANASFDFGHEHGRDHEQVPRLIEFLVSLGVEIEDNRGSNKS